MRKLSVLVIPKRIALIALAAIVCTSFAGGVLVQRSGTFYFLRTLFVRSPQPAWPEVKRALDQAFPATAANLMVGDSLTDRLDWHSAFPSTSLLKRSAEGSTIADLINSVPIYIQINPQKTFVMAGINDILQVHPLPVIAQQYGQLIDVLQSAGQHVVVSSTLAGRESEKAAVAALNARVRAKCESGACTYVDLAALLAPRGVMELAYSDDGIHLNAIGYAIWVEALRPHLASSSR